MVGNALRQILQKGQRMALLRQAGMLDHGHGRAAGQAAEQLAADALDAAHSHIDHQRQPGCMGRGGNLAPVGAAVAGFGMAGHEKYAMRAVAVGQRGAQAGQARETGGDAVDDIHLDAGLTQMFDLFAATAKDEGVAALEAHHAFAVLHGGNHELFDEGLGGALAAAALAHIDHAGRG